MKLKVFIGCMLVAAILTVASPVLALSLGVSPSQIELEVPGNGSASANVKIHYFSGDVNISLIDIPLRIEPSTIHVDASDEPEEVVLTIYGDNSLGSQIYDGYIRFIAVSGGAATGGVQVIAKITNLVEGETPVLATPEESQPPPEEAAVEESPPEQTLPEGSTAVTEPIPPLPPAPAPSGTTELNIPLLAVIAASTVIVIALIVLVARRKR